MINEDIILIGDRQYTLSGYLENEDCKSLLKYVDDNSEAIREILINEIQSFNDNLLHSVINETANDEQDLLMINMSLLFEKSMYKSEAYLYAIKIIAIREIAKSTLSKKITYKGRNCNFFRSLEFYCEDIKIIAEKKFINPFNFYNFRLFLSILSLLIHNVRFFNLTSCYEEKLNSISVFSYLYSTDKNECDQNYWGGLLKKLEINGFNINYGYMFVRGKGLPTSRAATKSVQIGDNVINGMMGIGTFLFLIMKFLKKRFFWKIFLKKVKKNWLTILFKKDLESSLAGKIYFENLCIAESFKDYLSKLPKQKCGIYLQENQGWERALNYYWRKYNHGKIFGVIHSMIRFWDLRYAESCSSKNEKILSVFKPNKSLINGFAQQLMLRSLNKIDTNYINVEAIRYLHDQDENCKRNYVGNILVLGDIDVVKTYKLLDDINLIKCEVEKIGEIWVKPHPVNLYKSEITKRYKFKEWTGSIKEACANFDIVIVNSSSSAIVDALLSGIFVICYLDDGINFSPIKGLGLEMYYASNSKEMLNGLKMALQKKPETTKEFFKLFNLNKNFNSFFEIIKQAND